MEIKLITKRRCKVGIQKLKQYEFISRARMIQTSLLQQPFVQISPSTEEVNAVLNRLQRIQMEIMSKNFSQVALRNELRKEAEEMLQRQCRFVNRVAKGDLRIMTQSGFPLTKEPKKKPIPSLSRITSVKAMPEPGTAQLRFKASKGRDRYEIQVFARNYEPILFTSTVPNMILDNLPVNTMMQVTVRGVNGRGAGEWCHSVNFIIPPDFEGNYIGPPMKTPTS